MFLDYRRSRDFGIPLDDLWNILPEGRQTLIGRYHYKVNWPAALNGPDGGNFDVKSDSVITFKPKQ